ncbi:MAG: hypothetical protein IT430_03115 [Phycisphaerales bacterium]|nr:hypothetical protein [Phycisphaerales bacterium]
MNARQDSTDSLWWKVFFTPVGPRLVVGRRWPGLPRRRPSAGALIDASDVPQALRDFVRTLVKRTRLWRQEKADVARELIAHFDDALQRTATADEVVREFGDSRCAAKLIRRAKKRQRPLIWQAWRRAVQAAELAVALVVVLWMAMVARYYAGAPEISRNFTAEANASILALPESECGWPHYRDALLSLEAPPPTSSDGRSIVSPQDAGWPAMVAYLNEHQNALELARRGAARPHLGVPLTTDDAGLRTHLAMLTGRQSSSADQEDQIFGWGSPMGVSETRPLTRLLLADVRLAVAEGDASRARSDLVALMDMASQFRESPMFVAEIFALDVLLSVSRAIDEILIESPAAFDEAQLTGLAHRFATFSGGGPIRLRFETHRAYFQDMMQRLYTDDGDGDGRLTDAGIRLLLQLGPDVPLMERSKGKGALDLLKAPLAAQLIGSRREVVEEFERQLAKMNQEAAIPMWQWETVPGNAFEQQLADEAYYRKYIPLYVLLPAVGRAATQAEIVMQRRDATLTAIALELYRRRNGVYPQSLDQLVPELLPAVPADRFDGQPLRYRLSDEGPLLYSIGSDRIDDGGKPAETEYQQLNVPRYSWRMPNPPMHVDWILWDGRRSQKDSDQ